MAYFNQFEHHFITRTLEIVKAYEGPYDSTLLLNCMLGLIVIPKESCLNAIPNEPLEDMKLWGISPESMISYGEFDENNPKFPKPDSLRGVVWCLRNSISHFRFEPFPNNDQDCEGFNFHDANGFKAKVLNTELRIFVERLWEHCQKA